MTDAVARFAPYVATLGRGPGRSRPLTREEAQDAMRLLLDGAPDPMQVGAFLMLLRYRGEDPEEMTGLTLAAQTRTALPGLNAALDWPSYGAGRTRPSPWFLLAALALGQAGVPVLMHGSNEFASGMTVPEALGTLGLAQRGFAYVPVEVLCPAFAALLGLRRLFGLRSPINTVARLLNPASAAAGVDGVFHPPYIETHLAVAERLARPRLLVLKGGGGEAERNSAKPTQLHLWDAAEGRSVVTAPALIGADADDALPDLAAIWRGEARHAAIEARIIGTIALGLIATGRGGDEEAQSLWEQRRREL
jgi:anthranilate phosphoribosyltransferase